MVTAQAASIPDNRIWREAIEEKLPLFLMSQRWLRRYGGGLLQLQCCTLFCRWVRKTQLTASQHQHTTILRSFTQARTIVTH